MNKKLYGLLGVLVLASMALSACGPAATATEAPPAVTEAPTANACAPAVANFDPTTAQMPASPKVLRAAWSQEPDQGTVTFSNMAYSDWLDQITQGELAKYDDKANEIPELATEIPSVDNGGVSADGLTITWHLKPCIFWSDGQPITSADVKFTWQVMTDPGNAVISRAGWDKVTGIDTPDDQTSVWHFSELFAPWYTLPLLYGFGGFSLLPEHILKGKTALEKDPFIHQPNVSSGPFVISEWTAGDHLTLVANPNYWQGHPKLDEITLKFVPDPETALAALEAGDVDWVPDFSESDIPTFAPLEPKIHLRTTAGGDFEHLFFNLGTTAGVDGKGKSDVDGFCPFKDVNVRKAIMLGTNREQYMDTLVFGKSRVPADLWPNSSWDNTALLPYPYDPDQANSLLDAAGYKVGGGGIRAGTCDGKPVKFSLSIETTTKQLRKDYVLAIQADLKKLGIEIKPVHTPAGTFFGSYGEGANLATGKFDMAIYTTGFYPDPFTDNFLCASVMSKDNPGGDNNYHICDPKLDDLFARSNQTADPAARKKLYDEIQQYMYDNVLIVPLYGRLTLDGYSDNFVPTASSGVSGFQWDPFDWDLK